MGAPSDWGSLLPVTALKERPVPHCDGEERTPGALSSMFCGSWSQGLWKDLPCQHPSLPINPSSYGHGPNGAPPPSSAGPGFTRARNLSWSWHASQPTQDHLTRNLRTCPGSHRHNSSPRRESMDHTGLSSFSLRVFQGQQNCPSGPRPSHWH